MRRLNDELDADELIDACIECVEALGTFATKDCADDWRNGISHIIETARGIAPSNLELDAYLADLQVTESEFYKLCSLETGLPLEWTPVVRITEGAKAENDELEERGLVWKDLITISREEGERAEKQAAERKAQDYAERWNLWNCDRDALDAYAAKHGRTWKSKLRHAWETGDYGDDDSQILQALRNHKCFGPEALIKYGTRAKAYARRRKTSAAR